LFSFIDIYAAIIKSQFFEQRSDIFYFELFHFFQSMFINKVEYLYKTSGRPTKISRRDRIFDAGGEIFNDFFPI
jgi:hypothetical protein